ncbi:unnamed protein product, partial [Urochloa humidicola]
GRGRTPSFADLERRLAVDDERRHGVDGPPAIDSMTEAPPREHHLHGLAFDAGATRRRGEEEPERTYSDTAPPPPSPRRRRPEP